MSHSPPGSIEDNYTTYVLETLGYQYDALELLDREALTRHDALRSSDREALGALDASDLDALELLAVAHRWRDLGDLPKSADALDALCAAPPHASVAIDEAFELFLLTLLEVGQVERAMRAFDAPPAWHEAWPRHALLEGLVLSLAGESARGASSLDGYIEKEERGRGERCYEVAELFMERQHITTASAWLERARDWAMSEEDRSLLVDIELLDAQIAHDHRRDLSIGGGHDEEE